MNNIEELRKLEETAWKTLQEMNELCNKIRSVWAYASIAREEAERNDVANENKTASAGPKLSIVEEVQL